MSEAKQKLILLAVPLSLSFTRNAFPANSKPRMSSCVSEPCKLNPCPSVCYLHVLPKVQGKEAWALPINLAKAFDNYLAKEGCLEDPFAKQILRNYQPCVSTPKTPEHHKERVNQKNTVYHKSCPRLFILQLRRNIPFTTMTWIVFCFGKHAMERNASTLTQDLGWDDIEGHLLEQLLKPTHTENNLMNCGRSAGRRSPLCYD